MRHQKSGRKFSRTSAHRQAMFENMAASLIKHELIRTTLPKAKELRRVAEPLITMAKTDGVANRRLAFARLRDKEAVGTLFTVLGPRYTARPGGYLRILKCGFRAGDNAPMAYVELVDRPEAAPASRELESRASARTETPASAGVFVSVGGPMRDCSGAGCAAAPALWRGAACHGIMRASIVTRMNPIRPLVIPRAVPAWLPAVCAALLGFAFYMQLHGGLRPCPLCIFQRVAFIMLGLVFLVGGLHAPRSAAGGVFMACWRWLRRAWASRSPAATSGSSTCRRTRCLHAARVWITCWS